MCISVYGIDLLQRTYIRPKKKTAQMCVGLDIKDKLSTRQKIVKLYISYL